VTRLFVAVWPPPAVLDAVAALPREEQPGVRWTTRHQWHVTLRFLGEADPEVVGAALDRAAPFPDAVALAGPGVARLGRRVLALPVEGLEALAGAVDTALQGLGRPRDHDRFRGHLTLARLTRAAPGAAIGFAVSARWTVEDVALVASTLHPEGARYTTVGTFPTIGPAGVGDAVCRP
jgi:2'-5' RNA ligase